MIMLGLIERFIRKAYKGLTIFGTLLFIPSAIVMLTAMVLLAVVEIFLVDIAWILFDFIDAKIDGNYWSLKKTIGWMMW